MSYRSLLFCPDERTARLVSQILTELEFAVEPLTEVFPAAKRLGEERFDALVVDCQSEQEAAVLFKAARESAQNHSSLSVAIVEGQAGVAKAFRIGANLVLSKPINVEQSKGTLRVARGLLRKNDLKPAAPALTPGKNNAKTVASPMAASAKPLEKPFVTEASAQANAPFSALEVEPDPIPQAEAAEAAVLESLPELTGNGLSPTPSVTAQIEAEPIAGASSGAATAVGRALEKPQIIERKPESLPPMVTNEPIVSQVPIPERVERETSDIPVFSSFESARVGSGGAAKFFKVAVFVVVVAAGGYFGWTRLRPLKYLQQMRASRTASDVTLPTSTPAPAPTAPTVRATTPTEVTQQPPVQNQHDLEISAAPVHSDSENDDADDIRVQELPMSRDSKPAPKAEPLVVKSDSAARKLKAAQPVPPPVQVSTANGAALPLSNLPESAPQLPKLAPNSLRVSQGVSQGLILKKVPPQYPQMALQLHKQGAVELQVTITKQGTISNVKVISGDALLARAAADAVHQWKYRPYLLDGEPVEIQTQITINFTAPH